MSLERGGDMINNTSGQAVLQNLKDAGCSPRMVQRFLSLETEENTNEQLKLLAEHRKHLLERVHREEKRIDCLDYLVYQLKKKSRTAM